MITQTERVALRLTKKEKDELYELAKKEGITFSEYIRAVLFGKRIRQREIVNEKNNGILTTSNNVTKHIVPANKKNKVRR